MTNPIKTTSRSYQTILNDINSDDNLIDKPNWWKRIWAGVGDMISQIVNASANQSFLRTAFTRQAVSDLCALIDYDLSSRVESSGILIFYLKGTAVFPVVVAQSDLAGQSVGSVTVSSKRFEARSGETVNAINETFTAIPATDILTVARDYTTGEKVRLTTTNTLPAPLAINTDYYVIRISATTIKLTTSLINAYAGTVIDITDAGVGVHTVHLYSFQVTCYQQEALTSPIVIGTSDGVTPWQEFDLTHQWVLESTISLTINSLSWTRVDTLVDSLSTDRHFKLLPKSNGRSYVLFGNGEYGMIPPAFEIYADYAYGGGIDSNISVANQINVYAGNDSNIDGVSNPSTFTGGAEEESITSAKRVAPLLLKARNRFITTEDGQALAEAYPGVALAIVNKNVYGLWTVQVVIIPSGGGLPSSALKTALASYLQALTILEQVSVTVDDPNYVTINPISTAKMLLGYSFANVLPFYRLCVRLLFSEYTQELVDDYNSNGITSAALLINNKWTDYTFTSDDHTQIITLLTEIEDRNLIPTFGQRYDESEVIGFINMFVEGIDYCTWTSPALPLQHASDEISTDGVMSGLTEIP